MNQQSLLALIGLTFSLLAIVLSLYVLKKRKKSKLLISSGSYQSTFSGLGSLWNKKTADIIVELEELLLSSDVGIQASQKILAELLQRQKNLSLKNGVDIKLELRKILLELLDFPHTLETESSPQVLMVVGVNGVGKTTSIGKLSYHLKQAGKKVLLGAADTFRAGAIAQLKHWADLNDLPILAQKEGADPGAVAFDAVQSGKAKNMDYVIIDTAGRLQSKQNLMEELKKVKRVMAKAMEGAPQEIILVLDANTGQNALSQAVEFHKVLNLTGIILTKWDSTAKGGALLGITQTLQVPILYLGIGEQKENLIPFDSEAYVDALLNN